MENAELCKIQGLFASTCFSSMSPPAKLAQYRQIDRPLGALSTLSNRKHSPKSDELRSFAATSGVQTGAITSVYSKSVAVPG